MLTIVQNSLQKSFDNLGDAYTGETSESSLSNVTNAEHGVNSWSGKDGYDFADDVDEDSAWRPGHA